MRLFLILLLFVTTSTAYGGVLEDLDAILAMPFAQRSAAADRLLERYPDNPVFDPQCPESPCTVLLYRGEGRELTETGDRTAWQAGPRWSHVQGTDLWFLKIRTAPDARLDYKIIRDGTYLLDPRNPDTCMGGFGPNSELRGPTYQRPAWLDQELETACRLDTLQLSSPQLGDVRTVVVVVPPGTADGPRPFLLVHDGLEYLTIAGLDHYLAVAGVRDDLTLPICVCVPPVRRTEEYATTRQAEFTRFVVETLIPLIETRYTDLGAAGEPWGSLGASYGGRITLDLARRYPDRFDRLAPMSPSIDAPQHLGIADLDPASLRLYVNWGVHDIPRLIPGCEDFVAMLRDKGFAHRVEVLPQGHSWGLWRDTLDAAFTYLYAR